MRVVEHWHRLLQEAVISPSFKILKIYQVVALGNMFWVTMLVQGLDEMISRDAFQPLLFWDLGLLSAP